MIIHKIRGDWERLEIGLLQIIGIVVNHRRRTCDFMTSPSDIRAPNFAMARGAERFYPVNCSSSLCRIHPQSAPTPLFKRHSCRCKLSDRDRSRRRRSRGWRGKEREREKGLLVPRRRGRPLKESRPLRGEKGQEGQPAEEEKREKERERVRRKDSGGMSWSQETEFTHLITRQWIRHREARDRGSLSWWGQRVGIHDRHRTRSALYCA